MAYVPVPKDLTKVKTKVMLNMTKRQLICFGGGALIGVPLFFLLKEPMGVSTAALVMVLIMLPFFLLAMYERNGQPLEKIVGNIVRVCFIRPKKRPYCACAASATVKGAKVVLLLDCAIPPVRGLYGTFVAFPSRSSYFHTQKRAFSFNWAGNTVVSVK
jgi:hypothetical protein